MARSYGSQVYWSFDFSAAQYNKVTDWWIEQTQGKNVHLYTGQPPIRLPMIRHRGTIR
nr:hypothetical protein [Paenibacillus larvae]